MNKDNVVGHFLLGAGFCGIGYLIGNMLGLLLGLIIALGFVIMFGTKTEGEDEP